MTDKPTDRESELGCRQARKQFALFRGAPGFGKELASPDRERLQLHLDDCPRCAGKYRLFEFERAVLDAAAAPEQISPGAEFFAGLRARIERGPELRLSRRDYESWAAALLPMARQMLPALCMLLILIIGTTLLWNGAPVPENQGGLAIVPSERVIFDDIYDVPKPTRDDVLETIIAVE